MLLIKPYIYTYPSVLLTHSIRAGTIPNRQFEISCLVLKDVVKMSRSYQVASGTAIAEVTILDVLCLVTLVTASKAALIQYMIQLKGGI